MSSGTIKVLFCAGIRAIQAVVSVTLLKVVRITRAIEAVVSVKQLKVRFSVQFNVLR